MGQELTEGGGHSRGDLANAAEKRKLNAWKRVKVRELLQEGGETKSGVASRGPVLGKLLMARNAQARLAAKGFQSPDLKEASVGASGRISLRSSHLQVISPGALKKQEI